MTDRIGTLVRKYQDMIRVSSFWNRPAAGLEMELPTAMLTDYARISRDYSWREEYPDTSDFFRRTGMLDVLEEAVRADKSCPYIICQLKVDFKNGKVDIAYTEIRPDWTVLTVTGEKPFKGGQETPPMRPEHKRRGNVTLDDFQMT